MLLGICAAIFIVLVGVLVILLRSPLHVSVAYRRVQQDDAGFFELRGLFGLIRIRRDLTYLDLRASREGPAIDTDQGPVDTSKRMLTAEEVWRALPDIEELRRLRKAAREVLTCLVVRQVRLRLHVGTGDAVTCGIACGAGWAILGMLLGKWSALSVFERPPDVQIEPDYGQRVFAGEANCILRLRPGHAISAAFRLALLWRRRKKQHGAPDSGTHANRHV